MTRTHFVLGIIALVIMPIVAYAFVAGFDKAVTVPVKPAPACYHEVLSYLEAHTQAKGDLTVTYVTYNKKTERLDVPEYGRPTTGKYVGIVQNREGKTMALVETATYSNTPDSLLFAQYVWYLNHAELGFIKPHCP